jgi:hypothetical protein
LDSVHELTFGIYQQDVEEADIKLGGRVFQLVSPKSITLLHHRYGEGFFFLINSSREVKFKEDSA